MMMTGISTAGLCTLLCAPGRIRTANLLVRSETPYPLGYGRKERVARFELAASGLEDRRPSTRTSPANGLLRSPGGQDRSMSTLQRAVSTWAARDLNPAPRIKSPLHHASMLTARMHYTLCPRTDSNRRPAG